MNKAPDRHERFVLPEGIKKVSYEKDKHPANAGTFTIQREDHTIGNAIRMQLHRDPNVSFAGYKVPHPLHYKVVLKIQTTTETYSPLKAYDQAIIDLTEELDQLQRLCEEI